MESVFGLCGKDFAIVAADSAAARSIICFKQDEDKVLELDQRRILGISAQDQANRMNFGDYIQKNLHLAKLRNGFTMSTKAIASYVRTELAASLRTRTPYVVNGILAGYDSTTSEPSLYWIDYMGSMQKVPFGVHGHCGAFLYSVLDNQWKADLTLDEAKSIIASCLETLRKRFLISQPVFTIKLVSKDGVQLLDQKDIMAKLKK
eukprot:g2580.t1